MDHIVNRESAEMRSFAAQADSTADALKDVCARLKRELSAAGTYMQDPSGQEAISAVSELAEEVLAATTFLKSLADQMKKSAELLEESDTLL